MGNVQRFRCAPERLLKTKASVSRVKALSASIGLSLLFLIIYGGCIWVTSRRHDVGVFFFAWERSIPFVPFMILPYMSIDLFFVAAPFFISSERELKLFVLRVATAIVAAGICFLVFPLRFAFSEGHADGWLGGLFDWFRVSDRRLHTIPPWYRARYRSDLVYPDRSFASPDAPAPHYRHHRRFRSGGSVLLRHPAKI